MTDCRGLKICLGLAWLGLFWGAMAQAQPQAMPATDLSGRPVVFGNPTAPVGAVCPPASIVPMPAPMETLDPFPAIPPSPTETVDPSLSVPAPVAWTNPWTLQIVPDGIMYKNYLAGMQESRFASQWVHDEHLGWLWDVALGGHIGLLRYGTQESLWPEGWQLDAEGAAFPRLDSDRNLISVDFRFGVPLTTRVGPWEGKFGYYHLSSHLADEYIICNPGSLLTRLNYSRDSLVLGIAYRIVPDLRLYGEANYAFNTDGGAKPWELQFGVDYSQVRQTTCCGSPFFAMNTAIRQDVDYRPNLTAEAGWQWRGVTGHLLRLGAQYFNGKSEQRQFYRTNEELLGGGVWYDY